MMSSSDVELSLNPPILAPSLEDAHKVPHGLAEEKVRCACWQDSQASNSSLEKVAVTATSHAHLQRAKRQCSWLFRPDQAPHAIHCDTDRLAPRSCSLALKCPLASEPDPCSAKPHQHERRLNVCFPYRVSRVLTILKMGLLMTRRKMSTARFHVAVEGAICGESFADGFGTISRRNSCQHVLACAQSARSWPHLHFFLSKRYCVDQLQSSRPVGLRIEFVGCFKDGLVFRAICCQHNYLGPIVRRRPRSFAFLPCQWLVIHGRR